MEHVYIISLTVLFYFCLHFISIQGLRNVGKDCNLRHFEKCCDGFKWNITLERCENCNIGFYGPNCQHRCFYPYFGQDCQKRCGCRAEECNFQTGCSFAQLMEDAAKKIMVTFQGVTDETRYSNFPTQVASKNSLKTVDLPKFNSQTLLMFGVFSGNGLTIIIILVVVSYCIRRKYTRYKTRRKANSALNVHYQVISENEAANINYSSDTNVEGIEISNTPQEPGTGIFVAQLNGPFQMERKNSSNFDSRERMSQTLPKGTLHEGRKNKEPANHSRGGNKLSDNGAYLTVVRN